MSRFATIDTTKRFMLVNFTPLSAEKGMNSKDHYQERQAALTENEAFRILGLPANADAEQVRKRYRELIVQVHPDTLPGKSAENRKHESAASGRPFAQTAETSAITSKTTQEAAIINLAYSLLQRAGKRTSDTGKASVMRNADGYAQNHDSEVSSDRSSGRWNAPCNPHAYCTREIYCRAEDSEGETIGVFPIAEGKYIWTPDEDFPLFLKSIYLCGKKLLAGSDSDVDNSEDMSPLQMKTLAALTYLLAQQFIDARTTLEELATKISPGNRSEDLLSGDVWLIPAMVELDRHLFPRRKQLPEKGEMLYPSALREHRLYLKDSSGKELGYLSFQDDRLYYVVVPLFEQHRVQVKTCVSSSQILQKKGKNRFPYLIVDLYLRFDTDMDLSLPENLNLQIKALLEC